MDLSLIKSSIAILILRTILGITLGLCRCSNGKKSTAPYHGTDVSHVALLYPVPGIFCPPDATPSLVARIQRRSLKLVKCHRRMIMVLFRTVPTTMRHETAKVALAKVVRCMFGAPRTWFHIQQLQRRVSCYPRKYRPDSEKRCSTLAELSLIP